MIYKSIVNNLNIKNEYINKIFNDSIYLDIETSGLSAQTSNIVSITFLVKESKESVMYQAFSVDEKEEEEALIILAQNALKKSNIITYNGNSFDLNYLNKKFKLYNIKFDIKNLNSIDLYKDIQILKNKIDTENMKLKTVEKYFDISRNDTLSGKDVITLYNAYMLHKKDEHRDLILLHNYEDVLNLPLLFDNILKTYDNTYISNVFGLLKLNNKNIKFNNKSVKIELYLTGNFKLDYNSETFWYKLSYRKMSSSIKVELFTSFFSTNSDNYIIYLDNNDLCINNYNTLPSLKDNIIPIVINGVLLYENIYIIVNIIVNSL